MTWTPVKTPGILGLRALLACALENSPPQNRPRFWRTPGAAFATSQNVKQINFFNFESKKGTPASDFGGLRALLSCGFLKKKYQELRKNQWDRGPKISDRLQLEIFWKLCANKFLEGAILRFWGAKTPCFGAILPHFGLILPHFWVIFVGFWGIRTRKKCPRPTFFWGVRSP